MRITKLSITNFRAFKKEQTIEFSPITMLFGANSTGKSTILLALAYIQQILSKGHCDPQYLDAFGDRKIGGFRSLINAQDLTKNIIINIEYEIGNSIFEGYGIDDNINFNPTPLAMIDPAGFVKSCAVELEVCWSSRHERAYVKQYRVWLNHEYIGCIESAEDSRNANITELNTMHTLLLPDNHSDWMESNFAEPNELSSSEIHTQFEAVLQLLNPNNQSSPAVSDATRSKSEFTNRIAQIAVSCADSGAIPFLGQQLKSELGSNYSEGGAEYLLGKIATSVLSQVFVLPLDVLLGYLQSSVFIGPLRCVPDIDFLPNPNPQQKDWMDGTAAWDYLYKSSASELFYSLALPDISNWFSAENKLNSGYRLINTSLEHEFHAEISANPMVEKLSSLLKKRHIFFQEISTGALLSPNQLGTGISQVLPIIVAAEYTRKGLISIEQPELHIHPSFQVELADVFTKALDKSVTNAPAFLIETHSEHVMLRLLRRVRETADGDLPSGAKAIKPEDISVIYLEPSPDGVLIKRININADGEFIDRWPKGFFGERRKELM